MTTKCQQCVSLTSTPGRQLSPGCVPRPGVALAQLPFGAFSHQRQGLCLSALRKKNPTDTLFKAQSGAMESQSRGLGSESPEEATQTLLSFAPAFGLVLNPPAAFHEAFLPCSSTHFHCFSLSPWESEEQPWTCVLLTCDSLQDNSD